MFDAENSRITMKALAELARHVHQIPNVVGVELLNAPDYDKTFQMQRWYERAVEAMRSALPAGDLDDFPIYIPDAWDPERFARWVGARQDFVVLDHHVLRSYMGHNQRFRKAWFPDGHEDIIAGSFREKLDTILRETRGKVIIGSWHGAKTLIEDPTDTERRITLNVQLNMYRSCCPGNFFSTYKTPNRPNLKSTIHSLEESKLLPDWLGGTRKRPINDISFPDFWRERGKAIGRRFFAVMSPRAWTNLQYCDTAAYKIQHPKNHERERRNIFAIFGEGFAVGWDDAITWATAENACGISELGFRQRWAEQRTTEYRSQLTNEMSWDPLPEHSVGWGVGYDAASKILIGPLA